MMKAALLYLLLLSSCHCLAEDGYRLWLRYDPIQNPKVLQQYRQTIRNICLPSNSPTLTAAREELARGLAGLGLTASDASPAGISANTLIAGTPASLAQLSGLRAEDDLRKTGPEGFRIITRHLGNRPVTLILANTDIGVLYGCFHFLRLLQTNTDIRNLAISSNPAFHYRMLDHWDNPNRFVERGYAGISLWDWHTLPDFIDPRYRDYARANASIGINGTVLNNVNGNALALSHEWLTKTAALAGVFRTYGIRVWLSARFSAPIELGGLKTADPLDPQVREWWKSKADEIYRLIPDFGGFLVKANSEGQPGPQNYGRTHADGANMMAEALAPHKGIVIWRAFVYSSESPDDRARQAFTEFQPLDGKFLDNVWVQVKNGPIDFQPREPFHPLFGAMPKTHLMPEFQLTQEYLGFSTHLVYLAPLIKECLDADTYANGAGSTVARIVTSTSASGIAAVSNIGNDINWTGHPFAQSNWYAFGRLAWDPSLTAASIAEEWARCTFSNEDSDLTIIKNIMLPSREIAVDYMTPLGLHHIMGYNHHYGPAPWYDKAPRADWNPVYYHKADPAGVGFDRTAHGSGALSQYKAGAAAQWANPDSCPLPWLLWFHHVAWDHKLSSGRTLWNELCHRYYSGADSARMMFDSWQHLKDHIDPRRFEEVSMRLQIQAKEARWWRDACVLYFQTFSRQPLPEDCERPEHDLAWYEALSFPFAPGIQTR